jgi:hypothetical protein
VFTSVLHDDTRDGRTPAGCHGDALLLLLAVSPERLDNLFYLVAVIRLMASEILSSHGGEDCDVLGCDVEWTYRW